MIMNYINNKLTIDSLNLLIIFQKLFYYLKINSVQLFLLKSMRVLKYLNSHSENENSVNAGLNFTGD